MSQLTRILRYGWQFMADRKYRNRVVGVLNRQLNGAEATAVKVDESTMCDRTFLQERRLFVAGGCDQTFLADYMQQQGMEVCHTNQIGRGTDPMTELMLPGSRALSENWDYYLFSISQVLRGTMQRMQNAGIDYPPEQQLSDLDAILDNYRQAITRIREKSAAPVFLFTYVLAYIPTYGLHEYRSMPDGGSLIEFWHTFHLKLYKLAREFSEVYVLDADQALANTGKRPAIDPTQSNGIFDHLSREGAREIGEQFIRSLQTLAPNRRRIKCAVFDLDNTLWAGVLREDGATGVSVNEYFLNVMEKMSARGILLALCSKNDPVEAEHLAGLLGEELYANVVSSKLSWLPKSQAIREIAEELNIGLDSLAFFDDSPFERGEVNANAPEVLTFDPERLFDCLNLPEFQPSGEITREALSRTEQYKQQAQRKSAEKTSGDNLDNFLQSCEFQLELRAPEAGEVSRVHELLQRTNQLNATLTRPTLGQLQQQHEDKATNLLRIAKLRDRFGDYGLIGFVTVKRTGADWEVLALAFSCRSMGRGIEKAVLNHIAQTAIQEGAKSVSIRFIVGPRNQQMFDILKECGFAPPSDAEPKEGECLLLTRPLTTDADYSIPAWLNLV